MLEQQETMQWLNRYSISTKPEIPDLNNVPNPYYQHPCNLKGNGEGVIFISSRFRSGSTLLWNIFRQADGFTSLYEPFNERQWFNADKRGGGVDNTHRGVTDYWKEYEGMDSLIALYNEDWIRNDLYMNENSWKPGMRAFIDQMITLAPERAVLQFNRIDFRLPWLRKQYPQAKFLHLFRDPRDQWCSFLTDKALMNKDDILDTYIDNFYLNMWCQDLSKFFPFLDKEITPHPYQRFYYLWKLSFLFGKKYADFSINYESLVREPVATLDSIFNSIGVSNLANKDKIAAMIDVKAIQVWAKYADESWFLFLETECESILSQFFRKIESSPV